MVPLAHGLLAPGHGAGSGARQRSGQDPKNHMIIRVLAPARRDGGRDEAARPLEVGCRWDAPAWVTQHLASGASAGVRRRASSDEAMGRRGHAPGAAGGALAEALPGGRRVASPLWAMATPGRALPEGFGSLCRTAAAKTQAFYRRVSPPGCGPSPWRVGPCLRSSARGTGQRRRRCRTSTRKASPARCGPWPRRAGACSRSSSHCTVRGFLHGSAPDAAALARDGQPALGSGQRGLTEARLA